MANVDHFNYFVWGFMPSSGKTHHATKLCVCFFLMTLCPQVLSALAGNCGKITTNENFKPPMKYASLKVRAFFFISGFGVWVNVKTNATGFFFLFLTIQTKQKCRKYSLKDVLECSVFCASLLTIEYKIQCSTEFLLWQLFENVYEFIICFRFSLLTTFIVSCIRLLPWRIFHFYSRFVFVFSWTFVPFRMWKNVLLINRLFYGPNWQLTNRLTERKMNEKEGSRTWVEVWQKCIVQIVFKSLILKIAIPCKLNTLKCTKRAITQRKSSDSVQTSWSVNRF